MVSKASEPQIRAGMENSEGEGVRGRRLDRVAGWRAGRRSLARAAATASGACGSERRSATPKSLGDSARANEHLAAGVGQASGRSTASRAAVAPRLRSVTDRRYRVAARTLASSALLSISDVVDPAQRLDAAVRAASHSACQRRPRLRRPARQRRSRNCTRAPASASAQRRAADRSTASATTLRGRRQRAWRSAWRRNSGGVGDERRFGAPRASSRGSSVGVDAGLGEQCAVERAHRRNRSRSRAPTHAAVRASGRAGAAKRGSSIRSRARALRPSIGSRGMRSAGRRSSRRLRAAAASGRLRRHAGGVGGGSGPAGSGAGSGSQVEQALERVEDLVAAAAAHPAFGDLRAGPARRGTPCRRRCSGWPGSWRRSCHGRFTPRAPTPSSGSSRRRGRRPRAGHQGA